MQAGGSRGARRFRAAVAAALSAALVVTCCSRAALASPAGEGDSKSGVTDPMTADTTVDPSETTTPSSAPVTTVPQVPTASCAPASGADLGPVRIGIVAPSGDDDARMRFIDKLPKTPSPDGRSVEVARTVGLDVAGLNDPKTADSVRNSLRAEVNALWADPSLTVVTIGSDATNEVTQINPGGPTESIDVLAEPPTAKAIAEARSKALVAPSVKSLTVLNRPATGTKPAVAIVDTPDRLSGETVAVDQIFVTLAGGITVGCSGSQMVLPAVVTTNAGAANGAPTPVLDAAAEVPAVADATNPAPALLVQSNRQDSAAIAEMNKTIDDLRKKNETLGQIQPADDGGGLGLTPLLILLILGLLGAVAYLVNRKPPAAAPAAAGGGMFMDGQAGSTAPGVLGGTMAPPAPVLPARYTEPAPIEHRKAPDPAPGWTGTIPGGSAVRLEDLGLMRVVAKESKSGKTWAHATNRWMLLGGWVEKVSGKGEDAEPAARIHQSGAGLLAVFDGTGGAGSASARRLSDGTDLSGAYVASRLSKEVAEAWATEQVDRNDGPVRAEELRDRLTRSLQDEAMYPDVPKNTMKGSLQRVLPTTMAAIRFAVGPEGIDADALWAGDSRAYVLTPRGGLQVLTIDDTRETDALELIRNDQPMANLISADRPFTVNHARYRIPSPAILLTATDGCFGYVRTPAHFEYLLLDSLERTSGLDEWAAEVVDSLAAIAADDSSFSLAAFGFGTYGDLQSAFEPRRTFLADNHWAPFQRAAGQSAEIEALRISSWAAYKDLYHARVIAEPEP